jgi:hypothetical protein
MKIWTASAVIRYYLDPSIDLLKVRERGNGRRITKGYYIVPHCDPGCCQSFGGISRKDLGPFATRLKARDWSRRYMAGNSSNSAH